MTIAIAILNWNGKSWLQKFLPSVVKFSTGADVYVIDNASTDDSIEYLSQNFPSVKIVQNDKNKGFTGGYNEGLKKISADIFCLLNSDIEVTENWLEPVRQIFAKNENVAAVQPKILSYHEKNKFEFAGAGGGFIDNLGYPYCRGRIFEKIEEDKGQYDDECEIFWASGCCLFIRSKDFFAMKGFDERFFAHQEEIDLCWRLKNSGRKIFYTGKSTVYHVGGGTLNKQSPKKTYLNMRNNLTMMFKNLNKRDLLWVIPARYILDGVAGIYFGVREGFPHLWAVVKAHGWIYAHMGETLRLRKKRNIKKYYGTKWLIFKHFL